MTCAEDLPCVVETPQNEYRWSETYFRLYLTALGAVTPLLSPLPGSTAEFRLECATEAARSALLIADAAFVALFQRADIDVEAFLRASIDTP